MDKPRHPETLVWESCKVTEEFIDHWSNNCDIPCPYFVGDFIVFNDISMGEGIPNCGIRESEVDDTHWIDLSLLNLLGYKTMKDDDG